MPAPEHLPVTLEECSPDGNDILEVLGRLSNILIGRGAYEAARKLRPESRIMLRSGARVIEDSGRG